jgi:hypothetical protein
MSSGRLILANYLINLFIKLGEMTERQWVTLLEGFKFFGHEKYFLAIKFIKIYGRIGLRSYRKF